MTGRIALLGLAFVLGQVFVFIPIEIWARNTSDLEYSGLYHLTGGLIVFALSFLALALLVKRLPEEWLPSVSAGLAAIGLLIWIYSSFLFQDSLQISGQNVPIPHTSLRIVELLMLVGAIAGAIYVLPRIAGVVAPLLVALLVMNVTLTGMRLAENWDKGVSPIPPSSAALWRHSTKGNVLVVVLDTLQSDVAAEVLAADEKLRSAFDGFTLFRNTVGVAPTTYASMISLHTGKTWDSQRSLFEQYEVDVRNGSFLAALARAGYETTHVNPMKNVCAAGATLCMRAKALSSNIGARLLLESVTLFDLTLLKAAPFFLKPRLFNAGRLFFSDKILPGGHLAGRLIEDLKLVDELAEKLRVDDGPRVAKLVHILSTHPPYVLGPDCQLQPAVLVGGHLNAARCALQKLAGYMSAIKQQGIFDRTMVVITADHGGMRPVRDGNGAPIAAPTEFALQAGSASPTLMIKKPNESHPFASSLESMSLIDIERVICRETKDCTATGPSGVTPRIYQHYVWKHEYWGRESIPNVRRFAIDGPVWEQSSWHEIGPSSSGLALIAK